MTAREHDNTTLRIVVRATRRHVGPSGREAEYVQASASCHRASTPQDDAKQPQQADGVPSGRNEREDRPPRQSDVSTCRRAHTPNCRSPHRSSAGRVPPRPATRDWSAGQGLGLQQASLRWTSCSQSPTAPHPAPLKGQGATRKAAAEARHRAIGIPGRRETPAAAARSRRHASCRLGAVAAGDDTQHGVPRPR